MSVLDQAFFKAYGLAEEPDEAEGLKAASAAERDSAAAAESCWLAQASCPVADNDATLALSESILACGSWSAGAVGQPGGQAEVAVFSQAMQPVAAQPPAVAEENAPVPQGEPSEVPSAEPAALAPQGPVPAPETAMGAAEASVPAPEAPAPGADASIPAADSHRKGFLPQLQVDRYFWPAAVIRLCQAAEGPLDAVIDIVAFEAAQGKNVVGVAHCRSGDGATTLLLCLARRLADHGVKVAMVDADRQSPRLARRLGVLAEAGWDDVGSRGLPLAEVAIESLHDRLVLVPRQETVPASLAGDAQQARPGGTAAGQAQEVSPTAVVRELRRHYDVVLVDLGHCAKDAAMLAAAGQRPWLDRVILVRHERRPRPAEFAAAVRQIQSLGIALAVVDNFV